MRKLILQEGVTAFIAVPTMLDDLAALTYSSESQQAGQPQQYPSVLKLLVGAGAMQHALKVRTLLRPRTQLEAPRSMQGNGLGERLRQA